MARLGSSSERKTRGQGDRPSPRRALRISPEQAPAKPTDKATHYIDSGLGGVFRVEVLRREGARALVRIHMPGTDWHHWQGEFWRESVELVEMPKAGT